MLKPEQAEEALKRLAKEPAQIAKLVKAIPEPDRPVAWALLDRDPSGNPYSWRDWEEGQNHVREAADRLDAMTPKRLAALWSAFFPRLDPRLFARAWRALRGASYQGTSERKAFRVPGDPARTREQRFRWLQAFIDIYARYNPDLDWLAAWAGHVEQYRKPSAPLLAAAIDAGGKPGAAVLQTLRDSASGTHDVGVMGEHVIRALLAAGNPDGWEFVEKLLLAAQRQEGLRQSILEAVDESHPDAFRRMLRLILEHDLARFSATVRALNAWLGYSWDSISAKVVKRTIERLVLYLDDHEARAQALASGEAEDAYLALWSIAHEDARAAIEAAAPLLDDTAAERRYVAVHLLKQVELIGSTLPYLQKAFDDPDVRVALRANEACLYGDAGELAGESDLFERAERLLERLPVKPAPLKPIVWPWNIVEADRKAVYETMLSCARGRPLARLTKHLPGLDASQRERLLDNIVGAAPDAPETRALLFDMAGDASASVRSAALKAIAKSPLAPEDALRLEALLGRKAEDLRQGVSDILLNQSDDDALASADRLMAASKGEPRRAGLELLRRLAEAGRRADECRKRAAAYKKKQSPLSANEARQVDAILDSGRKVATLDDALGLIDPAERTRPSPPRAHERPWMTPAALECLQSLSALIHKHRETHVVMASTEADTAPREGPLGSLAYGLWRPDPATPIAEDAGRLPLREVWESWWQSRPPALRDPDGLELVRAWALPSFGPDDFYDDDDDPEAPPPDALDWCFPQGLFAKVKKKLGDSSQALRYLPTVNSLIRWLVGLHPAPGTATFLLDAVETSFSRVTPEMLAFDQTKEGPSQFNWRESYDSPFLKWFEVAREHRTACGESWSAADRVRLFRLLRWKDEPGTAVPRDRPRLEELLDAFEAGGATTADLYDHLIGPPDGRYDRRHALRHLTRRKPAPELARIPTLREVVDRARARILEVELERGEAPTVASRLALALRTVNGVGALTRVLQALGSAPFLRGHHWGNDDGKSSVFSHLVRITFPDETDTPEAFADEVKRLAIPTDRLIELAIFAPQWASSVEHALQWPMLEEAVWWLHAHTKGGDWSVDDDIREVWTAEVARRTALTAYDLIDGAVDVAWFHRVHEALGPKRWPALDEAAKYASSGAGHTRARLFASAMLGNVTKAELNERIQSKRNADSLRALGLLPLAKGTARDHDLLDRYTQTQEFVRTSKQFGAQRQASEKRAAAIALDNLARTAGYPDPIRFEWAMEASAIADLRDGPVTVDVDGVTVALAIDDQGQAELSVSRADKPLKSIPPAVKKNQKVAALLERTDELKRQASRVRQSLETAMCRGDSFSGDELKQLAGHAILWPLLSRLVLVAEGIAGYPIKGGKALQNHSGTIEPVKPRETIRIAHPDDFLALGDWHLWQRDCFHSERVQPFKQVFRELYVLTDTERAERTRSLRYAGHQVNPRQALALLGARGWVNHPDEGVSRTFHDARIAAHLDVMGLDFTPGEVEGITIDSIWFLKRGEASAMPLEQVPPRLFSEAMRDLDLVVSVAHRGGVDPEASASTVEMRGSLLRETLALLRLDNVRVADTHALIDGQLGQYSLHLGSGVVHRQPGGALCIVPVGAQHRGRLFLPFADDDPRTAEVISKAILLARDTEIQDPSILAQIRTGR